MGKQRRQSNRGKANRGGGSGGRGAVLRGTQPNRGGDGAGAGERAPRDTVGVSAASSSRPTDILIGTAGDIVTYNYSNESGNVGALDRLRSDKLTSATYDSGSHSLSVVGERGDVPDSVLDKLIKRYGGASVKYVSYGPLE